MGEQWQCREKMVFVDCVVGANVACGLNSETMPLG